MPRQGLSAAPGGICVFPLASLRPIQLFRTGILVVFMAIALLGGGTPALTAGRGSEPNREERQLLDLVNESRLEHGLEPVRLDDRLSLVARDHALEMIRLDYFGHISPQNGSPGSRVKEAGISFISVGENLAGTPDVGAAHRALMKSPGHRLNILRDDAVVAGFAYVPGGPYGAMIVEILVAPAVPDLGAVAQTAEQAEVNGQAPEQVKEAGLAGENGGDLPAAAGGASAKGLQGRER